MWAKKGKLSGLWRPSGGPRGGGLVTCRTRKIARIKNSASRRPNPSDPATQRRSDIAKPMCPHS